MQDTTLWRSLDPKVQTLWRISSAVTGLLIGGAIVPVEFLALRRIESWPLPAGVLAAIVGLGLILLGVSLAGAGYRRAKFRVGEDDLAYSHGIVWRSQRFVNRGRIQHVDITAGPVSRALGLVDISVFVGGQMGAAISIPGLPKEEGEELRQVLLAGSVQKLVEAQVEAKAEAQVQPTPPPPLTPAPQAPPPIPPVDDRPDDPLNR
ncbi:MAG: PH domain-containing protein [Fimbriimonadaceae bacterium]|nr:PH domain-containing protein [Fimbriimonadaceae bacterium]